MNRKEFVEYFSVVWFDNSGEPKTLDNFYNTWELCKDVLKQDGEKVANFKPTVKEIQNFVEE